MQSFRFIHASDFHLETPPHGLAECRTRLREILLEAPYRAANNVFEAALRHEVDFVILSGDVVAPNLAGPRALVFLRDQFLRLAQQGIQLYWAGGEADQLATWPQALKWPSNVHFFPENHVGRFEHRRHELAICELVGQCRPAQGSLCFEHFTASDPNRFYHRRGPRRHKRDGYFRKRGSLLGTGRRARTNAAGRVSSAGSLPGHAAGPLASRARTAQLHAR